MIKDENHFEDEPFVLRRMQPSPKRRSAGELFVLKTDAGYLAGRVITTRAKWSQGDDIPDVNLLYIYRDLHADPDSISTDSLKIDKLLFAPVMTNNLGWSRGYFSTISSGQIGPNDRLQVHCFADTFGNYFDEQAKPLNGPVGLVGSFSLTSYLSIDTRIARAFGWQQGAVSS